MALSPPGNFFHALPRRSLMRPARPPPDTLRQSYYEPSTKRSNGGTAMRHARESKIKRCGGPESARRARRHACSGGVIEIPREVCSDICGELRIVGPTFEQLDFRDTGPGREASSDQPSLVHAIGASSRLGFRTRAGPAASEYAYTIAGTPRIDHHAEGCTGSTSRCHAPAERYGSQRRRSSRQQMTVW